jgi:hypothetical protein
VFLHRARDALLSLIVSRCTLTLGESVALVARGGPPEVEYILFDAGDIELRAREPGIIREAGYRTTVREARARLAVGGFTPAFAEEIAGALKPAAARAYARSTAALCVVEGLEAAEMLESASFDAAQGRYAGTWLDLNALAADLGLPLALALLRATGLAAQLSELPAEAPVALDTSELTALRKPGERTFKRIALSEVDGLRQAVATLVPRAAGGSEELASAGPSRAEVLAWLRDRALQRPATRQRLAALQAALHAREAPAQGPLAETAIWSLEAKLTRGDTTGVLDQIETIERHRGRVPGTTYLRARLALLTGNERPRAIAERMSALSSSMGSFHELQLLAAQAWWLAGDSRRARAFARDLLDNAGADEVLRTQALEVVQAAASPSSTRAVEAAVALSPDTPSVGSAPSGPAGPASSFGSAPSRPAGPASSFGSAPSGPAGPAYEPDVSAPEVVLPRPPLAPSGAELALPSASTQRGLPAATPPFPSTRDAPFLPPGSSLPPYRVEPRGDRVLSSRPPAGAVEIELVETWSLPAGSAEAEEESGPDGSRMLEESGPKPEPGSRTLEASGPERERGSLQGTGARLDETPRSGAGARIACTFLARELGSDLRVRRAVALHSDVDGLELAQRHLREALPDGCVRTADDHRTLMRHGAFLSELLARHLGARWVDVASVEPCQWAMLVPLARRHEVARVWPFARTLRFVAMGHKERDLVSYYLELHLRSR